MKPKSEKKIKKLTVKILFHSKDDCEVFLGGDNSNPSWEEYLNKYKGKYRKHFELIKEAIRENALIGITGETQQDMGITFKFSDGQHWGFTWRAWGDLMQSIINKNEGYMTYYM